MSIISDEVGSWRGQLLLTPREVSIILDIPTRQLRRWRDENAGPDFHRLGRNVIRYPSTAIQHHLNTHNHIR